MKSRSQSWEVDECDAESMSSARVQGDEDMMEPWSGSVRRAARSPSPLLPVVWARCGRVHADRVICARVARPRHLFAPALHIRATAAIIIRTKIYVLL